METTRVLRSNMQGLSGINLHICPLPWRIAISLIFRWNHFGNAKDTLGCQLVALFTILGVYHHSMESVASLNGDSLDPYIV